VIDVAGGAENDVLHKESSRLRASRAKQAMR